MPDVSTIILAAGQSRRMGAHNKLLLPIDGTPMIRRMVDVYSDATGGPVLVVTGYQADAIEDALAGSDARTVFNAAFEEGQATSVACGLKAAPATQELLIGLGDQPLLKAEHIRALLTAHRSGNTTQISIPAVDQQRGNPILVPANLRPRLLADPRSPGCKKFTRAHPEHVQYHALPAAGFYIDIDTPQAYAALTGSQLENAH